VAPWRRPLEESLETIRPSSHGSLGVNWSYVSGFFDGEGGICIYYGGSRRTLRLAFGLSQKSREVLDIIKTFLDTNGIHSTVGAPRNRTPYLRVNRAEDMVRMSKKMSLVVRDRQVRAARGYLEGKLTGREFLEVLNEEAKIGRRRPIIPEEIRLRYPLTRREARIAALEKACKAGNAANRNKMREKLLNVLPSLPVSFTSSDLMDALGVRRSAALKEGKYMESIGIVRTRRVSRRGRPWVLFEKTEVSPPSGPRTSRPYEHGQRRQ